MWCHLVLAVNYHLLLSAFFSFKIVRWRFTVKEGDCTGCASVYICTMINQLLITGFQIKSCEKMDVLFFHLISGGEIFSLIIYDYYSSRMCGLNSETETSAFRQQ